MQDAATPDRDYFPWRVAGGMVVLVLVLTVVALAQSGHQDEDPLANQVISGGAFGRVDGNGRQVLVPVDTGLARGMKEFRKAVAVPGRVVDMTYAGVRRDVADADSRGFGRSTGALFDADAPLGPDGDVLVATDGFLEDRQVVAITPVTAGECPQNVREALASRSGRAIAWCREVARVDGGGTLELARFAPKGHDALATLAYVDARGMVFLDYPATVDPEGTWRAEDGGEFPVADYRPLFAFRTARGLELAVRWAGPEGEAMDLYRQEGDAFVPYVAATWPRGDS